MKNIDRKVDQLLSGHNKQLSSSFTRTKKRAKKMIYLIGLIAIVGAVSIAGTFTYFVEMDIDITPGYLMTWDNLPAENLQVTESLSGIVGNSTYTFDHWLNLSADATDNISVDFSWIGDIDEGISPDLLYLGTPITSLEMAPGASYPLTTRYIIDEKINASSYSLTLVIT